MLLTTTPHQIMDKITVFVAGVAFSIMALMGGGVYFAIKATKTLPPLTAFGQEVPVLPSGHISQGAAHAPYNSNPPTSGQHYAQDAPWKVYDQALPDETLIHNLEHGGVWISYNPAKVDQTTRNQITAFTQNYSKVIVTPRPEDEAPIVLASWGKTASLTMFDQQKFRSFVELNLGHSPEPNAA